MIDAQRLLETLLPGITVDAAVSRQWSDGEQVIAGIRAAGRLPRVVVVGLGTNGPVSASDFDAMMSILAGETRVVLVDVHVDQPWQGEVNAVLRAGVSRYPNAVLVDWQAIASQNPQWFGADGTHVAVGGEGAEAYAFSVVAALTLAAHSWDEGASVSNPGRPNGRFAIARMLARLWPSIDVHRG
jgi:hypothetical protein